MENQEETQKNSKLIHALREAVGLIQMITFKELRQTLEKKYPKREKSDISMLAGSITGEIFGSNSPEKRFVTFRENNKGEIEQELLNLHENHAFLCRHITDALRIQVLCDNQEGSEDSTTLLRAKEMKYLLEEREVPLPSSFMATVREVGRQHNLVIPPMQISPDDDRCMVH